MAFFCRDAQRGVNELQSSCILYGPSMSGAMVGHIVDPRQNYRNTQNRKKSFKKLLTKFIQQHFPLGDEESGSLSPHILVFTCNAIKTEVVSKWMQSSILEKHHLYEALSTRASICREMCGQFIYMHLLVPRKLLS